MIDYFALGLIHALLAIALIRLSGRTDLDVDPGPLAERRGTMKPKKMRKVNDRRRANDQHRDPRDA